MATEPRGTSRRRVGAAVGIALLLVLAGAVVFTTTRHAGATGPGGSAARPGGAGGATRKRVAPLRLVKITPANGAKNVGYAVSIELHFSHALRPHATLPTITPAIPGTWTRPTPKILRFVPSGQLVPGSTEHVELGAGVAGPGATNGARLASPIEESFTVADGTMLRVQQLLAELDYLPYLFAPSGDGSAMARAEDALAGEPTDPGQVSRNPQSGSFIARFGAIPSQLAASFDIGSGGVATTGAVMAFEEDHNLTVDGIIGPDLWRALLVAVAAHAQTSRPYDYLIVTETEPEQLYVWRDGKVVYQSAANTGVYGATTQLGTFPVYLRFTSTTMSGVNPDGSHYSDPGVPYVAYFNGSDAVHGFVRGAYGFPQSDGCVELPVADAAVVFPTDPLGTLVTVTTGLLSPELHAAPPTYFQAAAAPTTPSSSATTSTTSTTLPSTTTTIPRHHRRSAPTTTSTTSTTTSTTSTTLPATTTSVAGPSGTS